MDDYSAAEISSYLSPGRRFFSHRITTNAVSKNYTKHKPRAYSMQVPKSWTKPVDVEMKDDSNVHYGGNSNTRDVQLGYSKEIDMADAQSTMPVFPRFPPAESPTTVELDSLPDAEDRLGTHDKPRKFQASVQEVGSPDSQASSLAKFESEVLGLLQNNRNKVQSIIMEAGRLEVFF